MRRIPTTLAHDAQAHARSAAGVDDPIAGSEVGRERLLDQTVRACGSSDHDRLMVHRMWRADRNHPDPLGADHLGDGRVSPHAVALAECYRSFLRRVAHGAERRSLECCERVGVHRADLAAPDHGSPNSIHTHRTSGWLVHLHRLKPRLSGIDFLIIWQSVPIDARLIPNRWVPAMNPA